MTTVTKVNTKALEKYMRQLFDEFGSVETLKQVSEYAADRILKRTKLGKGVAQEGDVAQPLKPLSDGYVLARKRAREAGRGKDGKFVKGAGKLDPTTSAKKSNLTFSGQMLRALKVLEVVKYKARIGVDSTARKDSELNNAEVAGFVSKDRPFLNLSRAELNGIQSLIRKIMDQFVRKP